jgi:hypothetical protein
MTFWELIFVAAIWGVPPLLLWWAWSRYGAVHAATNTNRSFVVGSLALLSLSSGMWVLLYALVLFDGYGKIAKSIQDLGSVTLAVVNIVVCFGSFVLSLFIPKIQEAIPLRRAVAVANAYLTLVWLFALSAAH